MMNNYGRDLSKMLSRSLDKLIILPILGATVLGNYQLAFQVLVILTIIPTTVYQYVLPRQASGQQNKKITGLTIIASVILAIIVFLAAPILLPIIFPKYEESIDIIQIMSFAIIPISITLMYTSKFLAMEKSRHIIISAIIFLAVQIAGIMILGDMYGVIGLAVATLLAAITEASYMGIVNRVYHFSK
jgi:O-antigen/teichoic acid export membrane protein